MGLKSLARKYHRPDFFYIHHGSISKELRNASEKRMKEPSERACVCATVTLELGLPVTDGI